MGKRQQRKGYIQHQEDKKQDRHKNLAAKKKAKGAPKVKKKVKPGMNYRRDEWLTDPLPIAPPITGEFAKAWNAHSKKTYFKGVAVGIMYGATLTLAVVCGLEYLK